MAPDADPRRGSVTGVFTWIGIVWALPPIAAAAAWSYAATPHATLHDFAPALAAAFTVGLVLGGLRAALGRLVLRPLAPLMRPTAGALGSLRTSPTPFPPSLIPKTEIGAVLASWNTLMQEAGDTRAREALSALITVMSRGFQPEGDRGNAALLDQLLRCALLLVHGDAALLRLRETDGSDSPAVARRRRLVSASGAAASPATQALDILPNAPESRTEPTVVTETGRAGAVGLAHLPIRMDGAQVGVLSVARSVPFDDRERDMLAALGGYLGLILDHLELSQRVFTQATRDALTGTLARRYVFEQLGHELARADLATRPVSVLMIDLDGFKVVNDRHGHQAGDDVLTRAAAAITHGLRFGGQVGRYGGDEFLVVLPAVPHDRALEIGQRIREAVVRALRYPRDGAAGFALTPSIGAATAPLHGKTPDALVALADAALYLAKQRGRNRVESASAVDSSCVAGAAAGTAS